MKKVAFIIPNVVADADSDYRSFASKLFAASGLSENTTTVFDFIDKQLSVKEAVDAVEGNFDEFVIMMPNSILVDSDSLRYRDNYLAYFLEKLKIKFSDTKITALCNMRDRFSAVMKKKIEGINFKPVEIEFSVIRKPTQRIGRERVKNAVKYSGGSLKDYVVPPDEKIRKGSVPFISFPLLTACNFKCIYCGEGGENTINKDGIFSIETLIDISIISKRNGIKKVRLTGGEPTLHKDFCDIIRFLSDFGFHVLVNTNGTHIEKIKNDIVKNAPDLHFSVSLDTLFEDQYNEITRSNGLFKDSLNGIDILKKLGYLARINMVVGQFNIDQVMDMIEYCKKVDCDLKLQEIVSVPYPHMDWKAIHIGLEELGKGLEKVADEVYIHTYSSHFGVPVKIYQMGNIFVTCKAMRCGSHLDLEGTCKSCDHKPCHEGLYDLYILADGSIGMCRWKRIGTLNTYDTDLKTAISSFRKAAFAPHKSDLNELIRTNKSDKYNL